MFKGRSAPLGIQKQKITDSAMSAFSHAGPGSEPWRARLDLGFQSEAWRAGEDTSEQYLQIDLGTSHNITHVAIKGSHMTGGSCWVTKYNLTYSLDGSPWEMYMEDEAVKVLQSGPIVFCRIGKTTESHRFDSCRELSFFLCPLLVMCRTLHIPCCMIKLKIYRNSFYIIISSPTKAILCNQGTTGRDCVIMTLS